MCVDDSVADVLQEISGPYCRCSESRRRLSAPCCVSKTLGDSNFTFYFLCKRTPFTAVASRARISSAGAAATWLRILTAAAAAAAAAASAAECQSAAAEATPHT